MPGQWLLYWDLIDPSKLGHYRRLARQIDGWLTRNEEAILFRLAGAVPSCQCIVELGSWLGRSTVLLGGGSSAGRGAPLFAVDYFAAAGAQKEFLEARGGEIARDYLPAFESNMRKAGLSNHIHAIRSGTAEAGQDWKGPRVGLLFIDADHNYPAVKRDWNAWLPHLVPGARVAFHDYQNPAFEVTRFVDELLLTGMLKKIDQRDSILCGEVMPDAAPR